MDITLFLARSFGLLYLLAGLSLLMNKGMYKKLVSEMRESMLSVFTLGFVAIIFGMWIIMNHTIWEWSHRGLITLIGWVMVIKYVFIMLWPKEMMSWGEQMAKSKSWTMFGSIVALLIGLCLTYQGFFV